MPEDDKVVLNFGPVPTDAVRQLYLSVMVAEKSLHSMGMENNFFRFWMTEIEKQLDRAQRFDILTR